MTIYKRNLCILLAGILTLLLIAIYNWPVLALDVAIIVLAVIVVLGFGLALVAHMGPP